MDTEETLDLDSGDEQSITAEMKNDLKSTAGWSQFLAILGFIGVGFMVLAAVGMLAFGSMMDTMPQQQGQEMPFSPALFGLIYLVLAGIYLIPLIYLYRFSADARSTAKTGSFTDLGSALKYLRKHYQFLGIMTIVVISLYFLMVIVLLAAGPAMTAP